jgi:hypothetical protein
MAVGETEKLNALINFYNEQCTHGRHTESQRQGITTILAGAAAGLIGLMGTLKFSLYSLPFAILIILIGVFGWQFMQIYHYKWEELSTRRDSYRKEIESEANIAPVGGGASKGRLRKLWKATFLGIILFGITCAGIVLVQAKRGGPSPDITECFLVGVR